MKTFCGAMDLPEPIQKSDYNRSVRYICNSVKIIAEKSMLNAAKQESEIGRQSGLTVSTMDFGKCVDIHRKRELSE